MCVDGALVDADEAAAFVAEIADDGAVVVSFARDLAEAAVVDLLFEGGAVAACVKSYENGKDRQLSRAGRGVM
jgi:hypothetical protein